MKITPPKKSKIEAIGKKIRHSGDTLLLVEDIDAINDWRAAHRMLLTRWQSILRQRLKSLGMKNSVLLAQRLKRYPTIINKLKRFEMNLANMNDVAGCRLIFKNLDDLHRFRESILKQSYFEHDLISGNKYDYITSPKDDGYRGIHDVYKFNNPKSPCNGLRIEIQYRTLTQHIWSTTSEALGMLSGYHTKFNDADPETLDYFRVTSELFSRAFENHKSCLADSNLTDLALDYIRLEMQLGILKHLEMYRVVQKSLNKTDKAQASIISFNASSPNKVPQVEIQFFKRQNDAFAHLTSLEKKYRNSPFSDVLFVQAESYAILDQLFPNYFIKTDDFSIKLQKALAFVAQEVCKEKLGFQLKKRFKRFLIRILIETKVYMLFSGYALRAARIQRRKI